MCAQASEALKRCGRGGMLVPPQLMAVASTLTGAVRLQRAVASGAKTARGYGYTGLLDALVNPTKVAGSRFACSVSSTAHQLCVQTFWHQRACQLHSL